MHGMWIQLDGNRGDIVMETGKLQNIDRQPSQDYDRIQVDNRWGYYWDSLQGLSAGDLVKYTLETWEKSNGGTGKTFKEVQKVEEDSPPEVKDSSEEVSQQEMMNRGLAIKCGSRIEAGRDNPTADGAIYQAEKILNWIQNSDKRSR